MLQGIIAFFFFIFKTTWHDSDASSDSGISGSWRSTESSTISDESTPLLLSTIGGYRGYTDEKIQYLEHSRKQDNEVRIMAISWYLNVFYIA